MSFFNSTTRSLRAVGLLTLVLMSSTARAQKATVNSPQSTQPATTIDVGVRISEVFTDRATKVLSRYISPNDFYVTVSAKSKDDTQPDLPYLPASQSSEALANLSNDELNNLLGAVNIDIWLNKKFDDETKQTLTQLVQSALGIKSPDAITVKDMQISNTTQTVDGETQKLLDKAQNDLRQALTELKALERERNDLKMENLLKANKGETPQKDYPSKPEQVSAKDDKPTEEEKKPAVVDQLIAAAPTLAIVLTAALVLIIVARTFSSSIRTVGSGMASVANALSSMGGSLGMKVESDNEDPSKSKKNDDVEKAAVTNQTVGSSTQSSSGNIHERIMRLHDEIIANMSERTESIILTSLTDMLQRPEYVAKAVATLELLGKERSNQLFKRLGKHSRETVLDFLQNGDYGRPKTELMLESGEALKTKLMAEGFGNLRGEMTIKMTEKMLALAEADYYDIFMELSDQYKPRFMFYLDSEALGRLLSTYGQKNPDSVELVMDLLSKIADVESRVDMDPYIISSIDNYLAGRKEDVQEKYVPYYQKILETMDGELAEKAVDKLGDKSHVLRSKLKGVVITINTMFKLPPEMRMNMIENMNNKQLASLICSLPEDQVATVWDSVSRRRVDLIKDEVEILKQMAPTAMRSLFNETKNTITTRLKKMRDSGELDAIIDTATDVTAPPNQTTLASPMLDAPDFSNERLSPKAISKLLALGFSEDDLSKCQDVALRQNISIVLALEDMGKVDSRVLIDGLAQAFECPAVHLEDRDLQKTILSLIPAELAQSLRIIPIERTANNLIIATGRPTSQALMALIQAKTNYTPRAVLASEYRINEALQKYYGADAVKNQSLPRAS